MMVHARACYGARGEACRKIDELLAERKRLEAEAAEIASSG